MTARDRRAIVVGAAALAAALFFLRVLPPGLRAAAAWRARASERQEMLARTHGLLATIPHLKDSLAELLPKVVALAPDLVEGRTPAEASAGLTSLVGFGAGRHNLRVVQIDPLPDSVAGAFGLVAVHAELEGDISGLSRLLRVIETGGPLLTVVALSVDVQDRGPRKDGPEALRLELTVAGYYVWREAQ
jgi:type II secretory pathway component PulM